MLQALREKTSGLIAKIVLGVLIFVFSFFGIESYFQARNQTWLAKIGSTEVTQDQFNDEMNRRRQQILQQSGGSADLSFLERPEIKQQILKQLVDQEVLLAANQKYGVTVPDQFVRDAILQEQGFQADGKFDANAYKAFLAGRGWTASHFEDVLRRDLGWRILPAEVTGSVVVTPLDIDNFIKLRDQTRDLRQITLERPSSADIKIDDAAIDDYYKQNTSQFMTAEQVSLEYVEIDAATLKLDVTPDENALRERYEREKARFVTPEQRLASHILVQAKGSDADAQKKALAKAQELAAQVKGGKPFADVARQNSEDLGSKAQGGDLGWLGQGDTNAAFDQVLFAMKKGDISDPILSDDGYHVIQLRDVREKKEKTFDEVKGELGKTMLESERASRFNDLAGKAVDAAQRDTASLEGAAKAAGTEAKKTELFSRAGGVGIAANPAVVKVAFSEMVLNGSNSDLIDLDADKKVIVRLAEHKPAEAKPLETVKEDIRKRLVDEQVAKQAKERADALVARLEKGETLDAIATELKLKPVESKGTGRTAANLDAAIVAAAFKAPRPAQGKPDYLAVPLAGASYAVVAIDAVHDGDPGKVDDAAREAVRTQLQNQTGTSNVLQLVESLRQEIKPEIDYERLTRQ
jgi:peptidyl-prolyl cis-trans isomerase D